MVHSRYHCYTVWRGTYFSHSFSVFLLAVGLLGIEESNLSQTHCSDDSPDILIYMCARSGIYVK